MSAKQHRFPVKVGYKPQQYDLTPVKGAQIPDTSEQAMQPFVAQMKGNQVQAELDGVATKLNNDMEMARVAAQTPDETFLSKLAPFAPSIEKVIGTFMEERDKETKKNLYNRAIEELEANSDRVWAQMTNQSDLTKELVERAKVSNTGNRFIRTLLASDATDEINKFQAAVEDLVPQHISAYKTLLREAGPKSPEEVAALSHKFMAQVENDLGIGTEEFDPSKALVIRAKLRTGINKESENYHVKLDTAAAEDILDDQIRVVMGGGSIEAAIKVMTGVRFGDQILSRTDASKKVFENLAKYAEHGGMTDAQYLRLAQSPGIIDKNKPLIEDQRPKFGLITAARNKYLERLAREKKAEEQRQAQELFAIFETETGGMPTEADVDRLKEKVFDINPALITKNSAYFNYWENGRTKDDLRDERHKDIIQSYIDRGVELPENVRLLLNPDIVKTFETELKQINAVYNSKEVKDTRKQGHLWIKTGTTEQDGTLGPEGLTLQFSLDKGSTATYERATQVFDKMYNDNLRDIRSARGDNPDNNADALAMTKNEILGLTKDSTSVWYYDDKGSTHLAKFPNLNRSYYTNTGRLKHPNRSAIEVSQATVVASNRNKFRARDQVIESKGDLTVLFDKGYWQTFFTPTQYKRDEQTVSLSGRLPANSVFNQMAQGVNRPALELYDIFAQTTGLVKPSSEIGPDLGVTPGLEDALSVYDGIPQNAFTEKKFQRGLFKLSGSSNIDEPLENLMSPETQAFERNLGSVVGDPEKLERFKQLGGVVE